MIVPMSRVPLEVHNPWFIPLPLPRPRTPEAAAPPEAAATQEAAATREAARPRA